MRKSVNKIQKDLVEHRKQELEKLVKSADTGRNKIKPVVSILVGKNFIEIIRSVLIEKHDLVIKTAGGKSNLSSIMFGSLDLHLLRKCPCPVWIIKPRRKINHSRILAAVDISPEEPVSIPLNSTIMELASSLSVMEQGELHVLNVWYVPGEQRLRNRHLWPYKSIQAMTREFHHIQKNNFDSLLSGFTSFSPQSHLIKGDPGVVIPRFVNNHGIDLIVMGTLARTGVAGFFIGNTAEKILNSVRCSVLAIKPAGFRTPVRL